MSKIAFIFPGQGAQYGGMGKDFYEQTEIGRDMYDKASELLGFSMPELCFTENDKLNITEYTQAAMVTTSLAMLRVLESKGIKPDVTAGLSLGEYCALVASGVMSDADAISIVRERGILMQEAVPTGQGAMSAILGLEAEVIEGVLTEMKYVQIANYNCPGQIVISGKVKAVEAANETLRSVGAKRTIMLNVSGPFHSEMLREAGDKLGNVLNHVTINRPEIPYVANVTASYVTEQSDIKELLKRQVFSPVRWHQSVLTMLDEGVDTFIEIGPGKTLTGFMKKISRDVTVLNIETLKDVDKIAEVIN